MRPLLACALLLVVGVGGPAAAQSRGHYLFAWAGDAERKGNDFLAVIDADPSSATYGKLVTTLVTDQQTGYVHHTEYEMPASGMLFANDHNAGRTFIFDVRDPLHPRIVTSFTEMAGYMHPHSFRRLANGHVLATFQHAHDDHMSGGLVEIDDQGHVIRSASSVDPAFPNALLTPYSLIVLPAIDRVVSTNSAMHDDDLFRGLTYQVWRLSDLKLLETEYFDQGANHYAEISPEEPRVGPDGAVYVQTLACGVERVTDIATDHPKSQLVYEFPAADCGVPTIIGHFFIEPDLDLHAVVVLDITNGAKPVEVSRLALGDNYFPHWSSWDAVTNRLVVTPGRSGDPRLYLLKLDQTTGALSIDAAFHDTDGKAGFNFANRTWPHGWRGSGAPHGVVFSR
ncbi:MAG TPA: hypothetical protein VFA43_03775 [Gemmatimonadaceae bacterium]|nr:hypothetical protein [Gemmatimonadaceae bacterium]